MLGKVATPCPIVGIVKAARREPPIQVSHQCAPAGVDGSVRREMAKLVAKVGSMRLSLKPDSNGHPPDTMHLPMTVGEFCQILSDASDSNRTWLQDFDREEVWVSEDLFVVMQAYWNFKSAA